MCVLCVCVFVCYVCAHLHVSIQVRELVHVSVFHVVLLMHPVLRVRVCVYSCMHCLGVYSLFMQITVLFSFIGITDNIRSNPQ